MCIRDRYNSGRLIGRDTMAKTYSATDIQVLEGLDAVRMRPGMYLSLIHI